MKAGNYTSFSSFDDRFAFSKKGIYYGRKDNEVLVILGFSIAAAVVWLWMIYTFFNTHISMNNALSSSVFGIVLFAGIIAIPFLYVGVVRTIMSGDEYSYTADSEKMLIVCPKKDIRADIIYKDVLYVDYKDITFFTRHRGYDVTVMCRSGECRFTYLFPYRLSPKDKTHDITPFRIIEEQAGIVERPEYYAGKRLDNISIQK